MNMNGSDESDTDEIPEINWSIQIRPYMYEPVPDVENSETSSEESDDNDDNDATHNNGAIGGNIPENTDCVWFHWFDKKISVNSWSGCADGFWCTCGCCQIMPSARECKCCHSTNVVDGKIEEAGIQCITHHEGFIVNCLNTHVLETSYYEYIQDNGPLEENEEVHEVYRYIAYRRFCRWIWKILGKKNRRILPSCVVTSIRNRFPSQNYAGFKYPQ